MGPGRPAPPSSSYGNSMARIAIIGSGPTGIYTLKGLISHPAGLSITVFEESPDPGKGTPYHPAVNDKAMLANIASIEIPPIIDSLVGWLRSRSNEELQNLGIARDAIGEREFYPRIVLGDYFAAQFYPPQQDYGDYDGYGYDDPYSPYPSPPYDENDQRYLEPGYREPRYRAPELERQRPSINIGRGTIEISTRRRTLTYTTSHACAG